MKSRARKNSKTSALSAVKKGSEKKLLELTQIIAQIGVSSIAK
jgi:hypothetical protein